MINLIVFVLNSLLRSEGGAKKVGEISRCERKKVYLFVKAEGIINYDYYRIEGCVFYIRAKGSGLSRRKKK